MIAFFERHSWQTLSAVWVIIAVGTIWVGPAALLTDPPVLTSVAGLISAIILMIVGMKSLRQLDSVVHEHVHADAEAATDAEYFAREIILARMLSGQSVMTYLAC